MDDALLEPTRHCIDVATFERMAEFGLLGDERRVELIDGDIIDMAPIGPDHEAALSYLNEMLVLACAGQAIVWPQNSIQIGISSLPQPDIAVLRHKDNRYRQGGRPTPDDVLLLVEIADSSLRFDRTVKMPLYARAGVVEVWIVDLKAQLVDVHRGPSAGAYADIRTHTAEDTLALAAAPGIAIPLARLFA